MAVHPIHHHIYLLLLMCIDSLSSVTYHVGFTLLSSPDDDDHIATISSMWQINNQDDIGYSSIVSFLYSSL